MEHVKIQDNETSDNEVRHLLPQAGATKSKTILKPRDNVKKPPNKLKINEDDESEIDEAEKETVKKDKKKIDMFAEKEVVVVNYNYSSSSGSLQEDKKTSIEEKVLDAETLFQVLSINEIERTSLFLNKPVEALSKALTISFLFLPSGESIFSKLHSTSKFLRDITNSKGYILYLVDLSTNELFITSARWEDYFKSRYGWKIDAGKTIATYVCRTKKSQIVNMQEVNLDYYQGTDIPNLYTSNVLSVPIMNFQDRCIGVLELYRINGIQYTVSQQQLVQFYLKWCGQSLHQNEECILYEKYYEVVMKIMADIELGFAFPYKRDEESESLQALFNILFFAKHTLNAESATVFLESNGALNRELSTDLLKDTLNGELRAQKELKIAKLTVHSLHSTQSFKDVYNDLRFDKEADIKCERIIRSVLAARFIREDRLTGVFQVVNKLIEDAFGTIDELFLKYILPYISIWSQLENRNILLRLQVIHNSMFADFITNQLSFEIDEKKLFNFENLPMGDLVEKIGNEYYQPSWDVIQHKLPLLVFYMMKSFCEKKVELLKTLYDFIHMVERCYEHKPLNNFEYAFNCLHSVYCLIKHNPNFFDSIEIFCIMTSCICAHITYVDIFKCSNKRCLSPFMTEYRRNSVIPQNNWIVQFILKASGILKAFKADEEHCLSCMITELMTTRNLRVSHANLRKLELIKSSKQLDFKNVEHRRLLRMLIVSASNMVVFYKPGSSYRKKFEQQFYSYYNLGKGINPTQNFTTYHGFLNTFANPVFKFMKYIFPNYDMVPF